MKKAYMTNGRWRSLMYGDGKGLTESEIQDGWHFCPDWDDLLIGPDDHEMECCNCPKVGDNEEEA